MAGAAAPAMLRCLVLWAGWARAASKGCFLPGAEVSMADGTVKPLRDVRPGDAVLSWDESAQRTAPSLVRAAPAYLREPRELVEVSLPHARFHATEDHPFWSRTRQALVSVRPDQTAAEYGLSASIFEAGEELEWHSNGSVRGIRASWRRSSALAEALVGRRASAASAGATADAGASAVEVMTLCLHPHHWYYVHGVRVHNKGCFAPWVRVLMGNGSQAPIAFVRPGDRVASWDSETGAASEATVHSIESFAPRELFQLSAVAGREGGEALVEVLDGQGGRGLVFTADHPIYSARARGPVSMRPNATLALYGVEAGQMLELETVSDHRGRELEALARPWRGEAPPAVMTLRLDGHHWFYAEGVRVHNKGGGFGGGHHSGFGHASRPSYRYRSSFTSNHAFAVFIIGQTRRRRNVWVSGGDCSYVSGADGGGATAYATSLCTRTVGSMEACSRCDNCRDAACTASISGCASFLSQLYSRCQSGSGAGAGVAILGLAVGACFCCAFARSAMPQALPNAAAMAARSEAREQLQGACQNGPGLGATQWQGFYSENGESKLTQYQWTADPSGRISGTATDDDGVAQITGAIQWSPDQERGQIAWQEVTQEITTEASGTILYAQAASWSLFGAAAPPSRPMKIEATYDSSLGVTGCVQLWMGMAPEPVPPPGTAIQLQNMAAPAPLQNLAGQERQPLVGGA